MATPKLNAIFREFLKSLASARVDWILIGGYAVGYHGFSRPTGDIDIWIAMSDENADRIVEALVDFGFDVPGLDRAIFLEAENIVRLGYPPHRIEILTTISGVQFDECRGRALEIELDGVPVRVISREDLVANKRASGRPKDLADLEELL